MKKTLKALVLFMLVGLMVISLTGCGGDKLVATKTTEDEMGKYEEKMTVKFKKDKVESVEWEMEFDKEELATSMYGILSLGMSMSEEEVEGFEIDQKGKKITIKMDAKAFEDSEGMSEGMSKDEIKKSLEEDGYKVK